LSGSCGLFHDLLFLYNLKPPLGAGYNGLSMDRKQLIREYKQTRRPAGVYRVLNRETGKCLLGSNTNIQAIFNRLRFQLERGLFPDADLQKDWNDLGPDAFAFEILDELEPADDPDYDSSEDLRVLKQMWQDKLCGSGVALYPRSRQK